MLLRGVRRAHKNVRHRSRGKKKFFCCTAFLACVGYFSSPRRASLSPFETPWARLDLGIMEETVSDAPSTASVNHQPRVSAHIWDHASAPLSPSSARRIPGFANAAHVVFNITTVATNTNLCLCMRSQLGLSTPTHSIEIHSLTSDSSAFLKALSLENARSEWFYVHVLRAIVPKSDHSLRLRYEYKGAEPRWLFLPYLDVITLNGSLDSLEFILLQTGMRRHQLEPTLQQMRMFTSTCPDKRHTNMPSETRILDSKYPHLVKVLSRTSKMNVRVEPSNARSRVIFRATNPAFHNGKVLYRYTDAHQCDSPHFVEGPASSYVVHSIDGVKAPKLHVGFNPDFTIFGKECYKGLEDPRTFNSTHFLASLQLGEKCRAHQVLVSDGLVVPLVSIRHGAPEKNWVHFHQNIIMYKLFDSTYTSTLITCAVKCRIYKQIAWKTGSRYSEISTIRSGSNWLPLTGRENVKFSIAHSAQQDGEGDWIYRSHYIWWDLASNKMSVSQPLWHTTPHVPKAQKGFVEFVSSIRYVSNSIIEVAFGSSDCFAVIASVDILRLIQEIENEAYLLARLTGVEVEDDFVDVQDSSLDIEVLTPVEFQRFPR